MKMIIFLFAGFLLVGLFFREWNAKTRLCLFLVAISAVLYVTLK